MRLSPVLVPISALILGFASGSMSKRNGTLSAAAQDLFDYSMAVQDLRYDSSYDFIWYPDHGPWSVRFTAWYTIGLLHRNQGDDVLHAKAALRNILDCQYTEDFHSAWYGTFKLSPDEPDPTPDSDLYAPEIYTTYDPNWREFIGTTLVQAVEEFEHLLGADLVCAIETSLTHAATGGMRRNGTYPDGDNLTPSYSNPAYMRAVTAAWLGQRLHNATYAAFADQQGAALLDLFARDGFDTLGEYNAPTYYGVDTWALCAAIAYAPAHSTIRSTAERVLPALWRDIAAHYNPTLRNLVGPYDRAYTRDMSTRSAILSLWFWALFGHSAPSPAPPQGEPDLLYDVAQGAQIALAAATALAHLPARLVPWLSSATYTGAAKQLQRRVRDVLPATSSSLSSSRGLVESVRNVSSWVSGPLMIGGVSVGVDEGGNRGDQFVPAIVHWAADPAHRPAPRVAFFSLYPTAARVQAVAGARRLRVSYPAAAAGEKERRIGEDIFTFALSGLPPRWLMAREGNRVEGLEELPCLRVEVGAEGLERLPVSYGSELRGHRYYNISYAVPEGFEGEPVVEFGFEYTC